MFAAVIDRGVMALAVSYQGDKTWSGKTDFLAKNTLFSPTILMFRSVYGYCLL